jgi:serine/threonine-protein kinase HipA
MDNLLVKLGEVKVGSLHRRSGDSWEFRFRSDYMQLRSRPILGQYFEDDLERVHRATLRLPPFFSNLLPEGALRELLARQAKVNEQREALLLWALGKDLPGAVVIEAGEEELLESEDKPPILERTENSSGVLKFSLAGVQLKFSVIRSGQRLTLPVSGMGGNWIVKLPDLAHPRLPANEFSMLRWARQVGIEVPDHELVDVASIDGLPREAVFSEPTALLVRRFDREGKGRIHQEDFAQVLNLFPGREKYEKFNYETIGSIVKAVAGSGAFLDYCRRLAFVVLSGNGDAHHKNWSLLYPDGVRASLAPAYDLVFTRAYYDTDELALNFRGSKRFEDVGLEGFRRLARRCALDEATVIDEVVDIAERIRSAWVELEADLPLSGEVRKKIRRHLDAIHL